jgi:hypothetical protein
VNQYSTKRILTDSREYISNAQIQLILESPKKYFARYGEGIKTPETQAMREGRILHSWVLEPEKFLTECIIAPYKDFRTNEAKEWRDAILESKPEAMIVTEEKHTEFKAIVEAVWSDEFVASTLSTARKEMHGYATHKSTQLYSRPDFITAEGLIGDLKFVRSASPRDFQNAQFFDGYYIQAAFYNMVDRIINNDQKAEDFIYIAVEKTYPHIVQVYTLGTIYEAMGQKKIDHAIDLITYFRSTDMEMKNKKLWPGYSFEVKELNPTYSHIVSDPIFEEFLTLGGV